jgi:ComF family protein
MQDSVKKALIKQTSRLFKLSAQTLSLLLFPEKCLECGAYFQADDRSYQPLSECFCPLCLGEEPLAIRAPFCLTCGIQLPAHHLDSHVCASCLKSPLMIEKIRASVVYKGMIKKAIALFKYHSKLLFSKPFERLLFQTYLEHYHEDDIDLIIPIPLHWSKLMQRGFNQAYILVHDFSGRHKKYFGSEPNWTVNNNLLERKKKTVTQTGFDIDQRRQNLKNAFILSDPLKIQNQSVLLVDDVLTTGATCSEAARLLLKNGAKKVQVLALARA